MTEDYGMGTAAPLKHVLVGTAGHIDHGKTRLIRRLTGIDTDRLPEEKTRGISIDLGFAHWLADGYRFGIVDVPGHERFVKNMVAGATGINLGLLVVAADDSVMPQTREHLEIMDLLGIPAGLVAITKIDLVEPEFVELVEAEVEELTEGTFLEGCPVIPFSSETGQGLGELKSALAEVAAKLQWPETQELFRMPIDRVFTISGQGSIVTGSVISGEVRPGDVLELLPEGREIRVRSVQHHGMSAEEGGIRQRTAINPAGIKAHEISRGQELATPGYLKPTRRLIVALQTLPSAPVVLKHRQEVNLHIGTKETVARLAMKGGQLEPGERAYAELRTNEPVVATFGQRFILRRVSPALTVAGGTVLDPNLAVGKRLKETARYASSFDTASELDRLSFLLSQCDFVPDSPLEAARRAGVMTQRYGPLLERLKEDGRLIRIGGGDRGLLIHRRRLEAVSGSVMRTIRSELERHQPRRTLPRNTVLSACRGIAGPELLEAVIGELLQTGELIETGGNIGPADAQVKLTKNQQQTLDGALEEIARAALSPPTVKALGEQFHQKPDDVLPLLKLCLDDGRLVRVSDDLFFSPQALEQARATCRELLEEKGEAGMSELREAWGTTRKYAVPLCEYFDSLGVTIRQGDVRIPGPQIDARLEFSA